MLHQQNEIIAERYKIIANCARGGLHLQITTETFRAFDVCESRSVMLTVFSFTEATDWKTIKSLFEREANILLSLNHPSIPKYIDYFEIDNIDTDNKCHFYLVHDEPVIGKSLAELFLGGWKPNETEVKKLAIQLLNTLNYLHSRSIIHQNIQPNNIILSKNNRVYLTNFGGIKNTFSYSQMRGILPDRRCTIIVEGFTYKSMEQTMGKPVPASDLYSVGYCLIYLLSGKFPHQLLRYLNTAQNNTTVEKIDLATQINVSPDFLRWLEKMTEQKPQDRFDSAAAAIKAIPIGSRAEIKRLVFDPLVKYKSKIARQFNYLKHKFFKGSGDRHSSKKKNSTIAKVVVAIVGLLTLPEFTVIGIGIWLFYLGCFYWVIRHKIWT